MKFKLLLLLFLPLAATQLIAQPPSVTAARAYRQAHEHEIIKEFAELLSVPNVASDAVNIRRNAELIARMLGQRGVKTRLLEAEGAPPVVYGEIVTPGATRTLVFYAHYDGQPVEPEKWTSGAPFQPTLYSAALEAGGKKVTPQPGQPLDPEWRLYARSSSDDKAPIMALAAALDALKAGGVALSVNVKFFFEGEEEAGSPHLAEIAAKHGELLKGDAWIICDGPVDQSRRQQLFFGVRGVAGLDITLYGPRRELHSRHYGNWAPNPAMMLARLLASMKGDDGRVLVEGFYDGVEPLGEAEKRALAEAPDNDAALRRELGIAWTEGRGRRLIELINLPSLNVRGLQSASVGATGRNVIPSSATASIDIRLVKGIDHRRAVDLVVEHVRRQGYHVVEAEPDEVARRTHPKLARVVRRGGYNAARTPMDLAVSRAVIRAVEEARGPVVKMPTLGGSVPLYVFTDTLKAPVIGVPIANHDNNQHSADENIRLQNLWDGIEVMAALLTMR
jgi:acetylornithine deacetylase/succinyl-diaminopimelate desuccinylase-like protein